jgi:hypothetical protein
MPRQNKILIRNGTTTPSAVDFDTAEPAWDKTAGKLYIKDGAGNMVEVGAGGGGGLTYFTEAESTTSPNNTVSVDSLTAAAATTNADVALVAKGTGATLAQVPDGTAAGGDKRGTRATDLQKIRAVAGQVASGTSSGIVAGEGNRASGQWTFVGGGVNNTASGIASTVAGGFDNIANGQYSGIVAGYGARASSNYSFVGGGQSNEAKTGTHATCAGGYLNDATGQYSFVGGGTSHTASGQYSFVGGGQAQIASGLYSSISGGRSNTASSSYAAVSGGFSNTASAYASSVAGGESNLASASHSFIAGGKRGSARLIVGYHVFPACNIPIANAAGVTQSALLLLARETTDATATVLTSNTSAASTTNQVILPNNSAYSFKGEVIAGVTAAGDTARWTIDGAIKRGANAASTAMVGTPTVTMTHNDAGAAAWAVAVTADTTNGGIKVEVTGAAATTIRWVCKINTTEMTY